MTTRCERRGQLEIGVVDHEGRSYAAFGSSVNGHNVTGYTRNRNGCITLTRWDGSTMLACRSQFVREFTDGSLALVFRLNHGRFLVGYALGDDRMLFSGELLTDCDRERASHEALELAEYWSQIDQEDEADPWHGEPDETALPRLVNGHGWGGVMTAPPDTDDKGVNNTKSKRGDDNMSPNETKKPYSTSGRSWQPPVPSKPSKMPVSRPMSS